MPASGSKVSKRAAKSSQKAGDEGKKRKKDVKPLKNYSRYIHKLVPRAQKKVGSKMIMRPQFTFSKRGIAILNSFVLDMFDRLATESGKLATFSGSKTLRAPHVMAAVKLHLPKDLGAHALGAATVAIGATGKKDKKSK
ncbi:hypothetical protein DIPPA_26292 [Diplonema papillatum]|nr:hypothetical protein DIPPA_26292 [Diplonema papillatum]